MRSSLSSSRSREALARVATAQRAARLAGRALLERFGRVQNVEHKGPVDLVTEADRLAQGIVHDVLAATWPRDGFVAEEDGAQSEGSSGWTWIVDPLDGTTNFVHGYPPFGVSVAAAYEGEVLAGVVYLPFTEELFEAVRHGGARRNGAPIAVSTTDGLDRALLATGFPYNRRSIAPALLERVRRAICVAHGFRRSGAATADLCALACGRIDGFWEQGLKPWDLAAGCLIVEEAGGRVTGFDLGPHDLGAGRTLASNGILHEALHEALFGPLR